MRWSGGVEEWWVEAWWVEGYPYNLHSTYIHATSVGVLKEIINHYWQDVSN